MKTRKQLSFIRLYKLASEYLVFVKATPTTIDSPMFVLRDFLKYVVEHRDDNI